MPAKTVDPKTKSTAAPKARRPRIAFPKKNTPPTEAEFSARLPLAAGKRLEMVRAFLKKQRGVAEDLYFYGPKTGWAYRYLRDAQQSIGSIMIHDERLLGIVALDPAATAAIDWGALSPVGQKAKKLAHGSPALIWIDVPLDGSGAADFKAVVKAKLATLARVPPPPPAPGTPAPR